MKYLSMAFLWFVCITSTWGQMTVDQRNHCDAVVQQAKGVADQLRGPNIVGGVTQPSAGTPAQTYVGVQNSISKDRQASDTVNAAWKQCELYDYTEDVTLRISYAFPAMQKDALKHRTEVIDVMESQLNVITLDAQNRTDAKDLTRIALYSLEAAKAKMDMDRATTQQAAALLYVPDMLAILPIRQLLTNKQISEVEAQRANAKLQRAQNWDVQLESGVHHQLFASTPAQTLPTAGTSGTGLYGGVTFSWGMGSHATDKHLEKGVEAYGKWKETQEGDVIKNAAALKQEIIDSVSALQSSQASLAGQQKIIDQNLELVKTSDTATGLAFGYQLKADRLMLRVEIEDTEYRLSVLQKYLEENF